MISEEIKNRILEYCTKPAGLGGWLGIPYEQEGCIKFAVKFYREMGIEADEETLHQARNFERVEEPQFGDIAVFHMPEGYHVAVMTDARHAMQCAVSTNGVGRIDVSRYPWFVWFKGFYRHKLCS